MELYIANTGEVPTLTLAVHRTVEYLMCILHRLLELFAIIKLGQGPAVLRDVFAEMFSLHLSSDSQLHTRSDTRVALHWRSNPLRFFFSASIESLYQTAFGLRAMVRLFIGACLCNGSNNVFS